VFRQRVDRCIANNSPGSGAGAPAPAQVRAACEQGYRQLLAPAARAAFDLDLLWPAETPTAPAGENPFGDVDFLFRGIVMLPALLLLVGGIAGGASMVGAEWQAGTMVTLLTWEPRRLRLFAARLVAAATVGFGIAVGLLGLFTVALVPTVLTKEGALPSADWWPVFVGIVFRLSAFVALTAAVGAALAMIARRTVVAVFALVGYVIGAEVILRQYWDTAQPWLLLRNLAVALGGGSSFEDASAWRGVAVLVGYSLVIIALAAAGFARRDVASSG
jgi:ABC-type transport system involved in multi-copper enzyme maturation permease subunit